MAIHSQRQRICAPCKELANRAFKKQSLHSKITLLDYISFVRKQTSKFISTTKTTHEKKLTGLGAKNSFTSCNPGRVIHNLSHRTLTQKEYFLLSFGLEFGLTISKPNFYKHFLAHEKIANHLKDEKNSTDSDLSTVINSIKQHAESSLKSCQNNKNSLSVFTKSDINVLKNLS